MVRYFTAYWTPDPWERHAYSEVVHSASNEYRRRGVSPGDRIYILNYRHKEYFLGARLTVGEMMTRRRAAEVFGCREDQMWDATDHVLAEPGTEERLDPDRVVPRDILRQLRFIRNDGTETRLRFDRDGAPNKQALRTVRELTPASAALLDSLVEWSGAPSVDQVLLIGFTRGPRSSTSPVHTVVFRRDGFASRQDLSSDPIARDLGLITPEVFAEMSEFAVRSGLFALEPLAAEEDEDLLPISDPPWVVIMVATAADERLFRIRGSDGPEVLCKLAARLQSVSEGVAWVPEADLIEDETDPKEQGGTPSSHGPVPVSPLTADGSSGTFQGG